jgi:hypothetical protein
MVRMTTSFFDICSLLIGDNLSGRIYQSRNELIRHTKGSHTSNVRAVPETDDQSDRNLSFLLGQWASHQHVI